MIRQQKGLFYNGIRLPNLILATSAPPIYGLLITGCFRPPSCEHDMYPTQGILTTHYHADHAGAVILLKAPQPTRSFWL